MTRSAALTVLALVVPHLGIAQDVVEPKSGVAFAQQANDMSLLGVGLRTKTFLRVKVYAVGLYVSDKALTGELAAHKKDLGSPAFYTALVQGDFAKEIVLRFVRDVSTNQIQDAFREALGGADPARLSEFVANFGDTKSGQEYRFHWSSAAVMEISVAGQSRAPINDKAFVAEVLGIWLGPRPVQEDIKVALVSRASMLLK
jgi:hypothetical protein